jgi:hypothetical protein
MREPGIQPGTLIVGKVHEFYTTFASSPNRKVGIVIKRLESSGKWILYQILYADGTIASEYEGFVMNYYEVFP